ncbi:MAG: hypothetical protein K2K63_14810 [Acetatifactor sp.]|nr:hypothetical protein [Acetatifactor sp.]
MRITNKIMQKNNLSNINTNKIYQDKLSTQMSTQKKINRPSDDPVVAIRALRLRSSVTEITQYYSKNIPDAESWLSVTEDALKNLSAITTNMITLCTKGANGPLKTEDRQIILEQLKKLGEEVYATGDADYAGRYVFTGYRTDTPLSFEAEKNIKYEITEQLTNSVIDSVTKVNIGKLADLNSANFNAEGENGDPGMKDIIEDDISAVDVHRIRLAYDDCYFEGNVKISFQKAQTDDAGNPVTDADGKIVYDTVTWSSASADNANKIEIMHSYDDPYNYVAAKADAVVFIPETGEVLLGEDRYQELMALKDDDTTLANESEIRVTYEKDHWQKGDLRPEHYFYCKSNPGDEEKEIVYNKSYLSVNADRQDIEYDVGYNQTIRVNSTADQCFKHGIGREVDDLVNAMQEVLDLEALQTSMNKMLEAMEDGTEDKKILQNQVDALGKALTLAKNKEQKLFEEGITAFQGYLGDANLCITECGTRSSKLELIKNRTQNQKTTFETLKSENEDIDITEVAIQLTSAELTYEAALMATGKVSQTTLMNFI